MEVSCAQYNSSDLQVLIHHIYEYNKGLRSLVLHTMSRSQEELAFHLLKKKNIAFFASNVNEKKVNIFFGDQTSVEIIKSFGGTPLNHLTDEQDFILGSMLGYDRKQQCERYLKRILKKKAIEIAV